VFSYWAPMMFNNKSENHIRYTSMLSDMIYLFYLNIVMTHYIWLTAVLYDTIEKSRISGNHLFQISKQWRNFSICIWQKTWVNGQWYYFATLLMEPFHDIKQCPLFNYLRELELSNLLRTGTCLCPPKSKDTEGSAVTNELQV